jgi:hypothetical protein
LESRTAFHGYTSMELTALPSEVSAMPSGVLPFMESRDNVVRLLHTTELPLAWISGPRSNLTVAARRVEN